MIPDPYAARRASNLRWRAVELALKRARFVSDQVVPKMKEQLGPMLEAKARGQMELYAKLQKTYYETYAPLEIAERQLAEALDAALNPPQAASASATPATTATRPTRRSNGGSHTISMGGSAR